MLLNRTNILQINVKILNTKQRTLKYIKQYTRIETN